MNPLANDSYMASNTTGEKRVSETGNPGHACFSLGSLEMSIGSTYVNLPVKVLQKVLVQRRVLILKRSTKFRFAGLDVIQSGISQFSHRLKRPQVWILVLKQSLVQCVSTEKSR